MVGGTRKDESVVLNSANVFAALDTLRKKKKSSASRKPKSKSSSKQIDAEKEVFWAPAPLNVKSWADVNDEDDDDYYATTAPSVSAWVTPADTNHEKHAAEASESEEEGLDEADDDVEEEHENDDEPEASVTVEPIVKKPSEASSAHKEPERKLSKKELKKKGLEELEEVLTELGYGVRDDSPSGVKGEKTENNLEAEKKDNVIGESKTSKKKKKKEKMVKEDKDSEDQPHGADRGHGTDEATVTDKADDASSIDVKARLKKVVNTKKKKSSKEIDVAARAASVEAAARRAKLAAAKKKEKTHYNQQPVR